MSEDSKERSTFEQLLRPLRRELNTELAAILLRLRADDEMQARYDDLGSGRAKHRRAADAR